MKKFLFGLFVGGIVGFFLGFFFFVWVDEEEKLQHQIEEQAIAKIAEKAKSSNSGSVSTTSSSQTKPSVTTSHESTAVKS